MRQRLLPTLCGLLACTAAARAELTDIEQRWLEAARPVLAHALHQQLPLDVVVQPQARRGEAPLAMGFVDGRCKLVLTLRGEPAADVELQDIEPALRSVLMQAMAAHELAHCWRYVQGAWHSVPAGFAESAEHSDGDAHLAALHREMRDARREEGFADLAGLAWTSSRHPEHYARVHAWFSAVRRDPPVPGGHHDTQAWIALAADPAGFAAGSDAFRQALPLWRQGLLLQRQALPDEALAGHPAAAVPAR